MTTEKTPGAVPSIRRPFPTIAVAVAAALTVGYLAFWAWPRSDSRGAMQLREFARLPATHNGRVMPLDTVARTTLLAMSHRQTAADGAGKRRAPVEWLLDTMVSPPRNDQVLVEMLNRPDGGGPAYAYKVFRIDNDEVLSVIGLEANPDKNPGFRFSFEEITASKSFPNFLKRADTLSEAENPKARTLADNKVLELYGNLSSFYAMTALASPQAVPASKAGDNWAALRNQLGEGGDDLAAKAAAGYEAMLKAYRGGDAAGFNSALAEYRDVLQKEMPSVVSKARLETYLNEFAPFYHSAIVYAALFLLVCVGWLTRSEPLRVAALVGAVLVLLVHSWAIVVRMYLMDRMFAPVTNLYSSAIFIGWGCAILCVGVEALYRNGLALAVGTITGALSLLVAHLLASDDTMGVLQAVLDTTFWLATHVVCITFGYTATFVAGFMGVAYILAGRFSTKLAGEAAVNLGKMIYGVLCFAMFLSFTGTVLGGIWADQSWGRFWGWDPKENGALLIVLWVALILHARWGGMIKQRGMAVLAVAGNMVTAWSWFGTNLLGVGLHAYGFMQGAFWGLALFDLVMLAVIAVGLTPLRDWKSFQAAGSRRQAAGSENLASGGPAIQGA